jgi:hypothetical protein
MDKLAPLTADVKSLDCATLHATFVGASEIVKLANNTRSAAPVRDASQQAAYSANSIAEINKRNSDFWSRQK